MALPVPQVRLFMNPLSQIIIALIVAVLLWSVIPPLLAWARERRRGT